VIGTHVDDVLALASFSSIWAGAMGLLGNSHLVDITSSITKVDDLFLISSILAETSLTIDQEHALGLDTT
jgi:hypothetical protein